MAEVLGWAKGGKRSSDQAASGPDLLSLFLISGLAFVVVGGADIALTFYPLNVGNAEWEFGTVTTVLNALALPTLGLVLIALWAGQRGVKWVQTALMWLFWVAALAVVLAGVLYAMTLPMALGSTGDPVIRVGVRKAITRSVVQMAIYTIAYVWIGFQIRRYRSVVHVNREE